MRIIVTGGAGFIGSAVVRLCLRSGHIALNVDKLTYAADLRSLDEVLPNERYSLHQADICDSNAVAQALDTFKPDAVMHLAAESHVDRSIDGPAAFVETNIVGTHVLLEATRDYWQNLPNADKAKFRFLHVSTDEVYGTLGAGGLFTETSRYQPNSPYSASKASSDFLARAWHRTYGLPVIITNCSNNYGPYQFPEKLIPVVILSALERRQIPVYGRGENTRDWLHVEDHAKALLRVLECGVPGETYNIGGHNERRNIDLIHAICRTLDKLAPSGNAPYEELIEFVSDRPGHDMRYAIDATKISTELGWKPSITIESGIERTVRWYLDNRWWWEPLRHRGGIGKRIGINSDLYGSRQPANEADGSFDLRAEARHAKTVLG